MMGPNRSAPHLHFHLNYNIIRICTVQQSAELSQILVHARSVVRTGER